MPQVIETQVFQIDELTGSAREAARDWYRHGAFDDDWYAFIFEDFERICTTLGLTLRTRPVRLMGGGARYEPSIFFSGFASQGDGACFEGSYRYAPQMVSSIRAYAPKDEVLRGIADRLFAAQRRNFYQLRAAIRQTGRNCHEYSMVISVTRENAAGQDLSLGDEEVLIEVFRDLARWLYRQLEAEHDYQCADERVDEALRANGYTFTEAGRRFG